MTSKYRESHDPSALLLLARYFDVIHWPFCKASLKDERASNAGYTPEDNRADFGAISPLPTILGNVPIISVDLKIILSDFPEV